MVPWNVNQRGRLNFKIEELSSSGDSQEEGIKYFLGLAHILKRFAQQRLVQVDCNNLARFGRCRVLAEVTGNEQIAWDRLVRALPSRLGWSFETW
jgi:hypothetical protein